MFKLCSCALVLFLLASSASSLCMRPQPRLVCAEFFSSQVVVIAHLMRARHFKAKNDDAIDYSLYTMHTDQVLRGKIDATFRVNDLNSPAGAAFLWEVGETYLLFISYSSEDHAWVLDNCGNSDPLRSSAQALREIERIGAATGGVVAGEIWDGSGVTISGVTIIVQGRSGTFRTRSDKEGQFSVHVLAGVYSARAVEPGARFVVDALSYEKPRHVRIENGSCVQIAFDRIEAEPKQPPGRPSGR